MTTIRLALAVATFALAMPPSPPAGATPQGRSSRLAVWDTGSASARTLDPQAVAKQDGWRRISRNELASSFKGDAVVSSGQVLVVVRKRGSGVELYGMGPKGAALRATLRLLSDKGKPAARLTRLALVENTRGAARLEAAYRTKRGTALSATFRLKRGDVSLEIAPGKGAGRLSVECPSRYLVLPDFFADDMVFKADEIPPEAIELPTENFLLHLTGDGDALAMCVFENREQDVRVGLAGTGSGRVFSASEIRFGKGKKIWLALLERPGVWHALDVKPDDAGKVMRLEWSMPFAACWRVDFTQTEKLTDSWDMLLQKQKGGTYLKPAWLGGRKMTLPPDRKRWTTVLGTFRYPCWSDPEGRGYLQPLKNRELTLQGPVVIYPFNRVEDTPADTYTMLDLARNCLGVGPCEYILDVESKKRQYRGSATCSIRDRLQRIYSRKEQKRKRSEVETALNSAMEFVTHIRGRIDRYVKFGREIRAFLADRQKANPELKESLAELDRLARIIDARVAARRDKISTPADVAKLNDAFRKNVKDYDGPDALERCKKYTKALVQVGSNQDHLVAECRWAVKALRQRAGIMKALDPRITEVAAEIRARTDKVLRNPAGHEYAGH